MGVGRPDCWLLKVFGEHVNQAFGHRAYHVGSSLTEKHGWRDVDVRLLLPDDEYADAFGDPTTPEHRMSKLRMWEWAWSEAGRRLTKLPIDFQIQQVTLANELFEGPRSALLVLSSELSTTFDTRMVPDA